MGRKKTPKFEALVVNAIRRLQDAQGLSPREISNYISKEYDVPSTEIKKQIKLALKRGVSYGILQRSKGGHYTCAQDFLRKQPMDKHDINELKCRSRRRRSRGSRRRSSRRRRGRSRCISRRSGRRKGRRRKSRSSRRSLCKRRHHRRSRRSRCRSGRRRSRSRSRRRRKRHSGRRCDTSENMEMEEMPKKQSRTNKDDDNNSRTESLSERSSLTDPDGSIRDQQSINQPITDMY